MITVKERDKAKKSDSTQCFIATAVAKAVTRAEWTEGIHQLQRALFKSIFPELYQVINHLSIIAKKNEIAGIVSKLV